MLHSALPGLADRVREAREYALSRGLLKYGAQGQVVHLPFTLTPWQAPERFVQQVHSLAGSFNRLYARVSHDHDFLRQTLEPAARTDEFVSRMLACLPEDPPGRPELFLTRNDFMPLQTPEGPSPRQVEINMIAASLGPASQKVNDLQRFLYREEDLGKRILPTRPGDEQIRVLVQAWRLFGDPQARILFVLPPGEKGVFDQLTLASALVLEHGVPMLRCTMEELGREGEIRAGDLWFRGRRVAMGYFRGGYAPAHYEGEASWNARRLLEASTAISVPSIPAQLANMKMVQGRLTSAEVLRRYLPDSEADAVAATFVAMAPPSEEVTWNGRRAPARDLALAFPEDWVLKPQREGGGNNLYGQDMVRRLQAMRPEEDPAFILMEYIRPAAFHSVRLVENEPVEGMCLTEFGTFGAFLMEPGGLERPLVDEDLGYLLRTKDHQSREGLVIGGYAALDVLALEESTRCPRPGEGNPSAR